MHYLVRLIVNEQEIEVEFPLGHGVVMSFAGPHSEVVGKFDAHGTFHVEKLTITDEHKATLLLDWIEEGIQQAVGEEVDYVKEPYG